jgi:hypothetical protein
MSPEQAKGEEVDRRTDVFAAGVILYELSLGRKLYRGTDYQILNQIVKGQIDAPKMVDPDYDPKLEQIVLRALSVEREQRYQSAQELQLDLEALARERGLFLSATGLKGFMGELFGKKLDAWREAQQQGRSLVEHLELVASYEDDSEPLPEPPPVKRRPTWVWAAVGLTLAGAGGVAAWRLRGAPASPPAPVSAPAAATRELPSPREAPTAPVIPAPTTAPAPTGTATVKVVTHPHQAAVLLDGKPVGGHSPFQLEKIPAGEHTLVAQLAGHAEASKRIKVDANQSATITFNLVKARPGTAPAAAPAHPVAVPTATAPAPAATAAPAKLEGQGNLAIASNPWCIVTVDDVERGQTPINLTLPAGKHQVTLVNPDYKIRRQLSVTILPNETVRKKLDFTE